MTENRITELWNKAVAEIGDCTYPQIITRFAEFVALDEREACAKVCDMHAENMARHGDTALAEQSRQDAVAIRARSNAELRGAKPIGEASRSNAVLGVD